MKNYLKILKNKIDKNIIFYFIIIIISMSILIFLDLNKIEYNYTISIIEKSLVCSVAVLSMNMIIGFTGLFSLGHAGFMAIGAYITAILTIPTVLKSNVYYMNGMYSFIENITIPIPIALILGGLITAFVSAIIGYPILRLKSDYLTIATLGFSEIIRNIIASPMMNKITNGSYGLKSIPGFSSSLECFIYSSICIILMILIINSSIGRDFKAVREDEIAARSLGISVSKTKQLSFVVSSFFTGIAGGLFAIFMRSIDTKTFSVVFTYNILLVVVLGGIGSITGSIIGSFFITISEELLRFFDEPLIIFGFNISLFRPGFRMIIFSILLMVIVLFFRKGIMGGKELSLYQLKKILYKKKKES